MKQFILGFLIGTIIMFFAGKLWFLLPNSLGGRNDLLENSFVACRDLNKKALDRGTVEVTVIKNGRPQTDLEVDASIKKPPVIEHPRYAGEFGLAEKLCAQNTSDKGAAVFKDIPAGTAYVFFNNDVSNYIKRYGAPNFTINTLEVKKDQVVKITIEL